MRLHSNSASQLEIEPQTWPGRYLIVELSHRPGELGQVESIGSDGAKPSRVAENALEVPFVDVHDGTVGSPCSIRKSQALVQTAGCLVGLVYADVHRVGSPPTSFLHGCIHEGPPDAGPAKGGDDV